MTSSGKGTVAAVLGFGLWGVLPIYWKQLDFIDHQSVVAQRVLWSCLFLWPLIWLGKSVVFSNWRTSLWHLLSGTLISVNWLVYVWATVNERMIEGALGYYLNPFFNMLFGALWFGERQNRLQILAIGTAFAGVMIQVAGVGHVPWIALVLGVTFALYGVVRKRSPLGTLPGLTLETSFLVPVALGWLIWKHGNLGEAFGESTAHAWWLIGTGVVTMVPLLLFGFASRNIRLSTLGMLQFIGPTLQFFIGWKMYGEPMDGVRLASFGLIWLAIGIYAADALRTRQRGLAERREAG